MSSAVQVDIASRALEHVTGLAAGRRAGIEDAFAWLRIEQFDGTAGRRRPAPTGCHRGNRASARTSVGGESRIASGAQGWRSALNPAASSAAMLRRDVRAHAVGAQPQRRMGVVGVEHLVRCIAAAFLAQRLDDPARVRGAQREIAVDRVQDVRLLALEAAQDGIHEPRRFLEAEHARGTDRFGHRGVRRRFAGDELLQPDFQQCTQAGLQLLRRALGQRLQDRGQPEVPAQRAVAERALQSARRTFVGRLGQQFVERAAPIDHLGDDARGVGANLGGSTVCSRCVSKARTGQAAGI